MGGRVFLSSSSSLKPTAVAVFVFQITLLSFLSIAPTNAHRDPEDDIATTNATPPPPVDLGSAVKPNAFRPSIAVIVGVLTTLFTVTFLLLLYARHCKRGSFVLLGTTTTSGPPVGAGLRKNSGIDRAVVESLPVFRFGSLRGHKDGLDCAVCLTRFEPTEVLRLLPKCKHAFHVECVDTWLDAHSTCPLCRYRVDPEDILLIEDARLLHHQNSSQPPTPPPNSQPKRRRHRHRKRPGFPPRIGPTLLRIRPTRLLLRLFPVGPPLPRQLDLAPKKPRTLLLRQLRL